MERDFCFGRFWEDDLYLKSSLRGATFQDKATKAPSIHDITVDGEHLKDAAFTVDQSEVTLVRVGGNWVSWLQ